MRGGPTFAEWEADFGRTFVLGDDSTASGSRAASRRRRQLLTLQR